MYKQLDIKDYETKWIEAERELAISGAVSPSEQEAFSEEDIIDSQKQACKRIQKPESAPKSP